MTKRKRRSDRPPIAAGKYLDRSVDKGIIHNVKKKNLNVNFDQEKGAVVEDRSAVLKTNPFLNLNQASLFPSNSALGTSSKNDEKKDVAVVNYNIKCEEEYSEEEDEKDIFPLILSFLELSNTGSSNTTTENRHKKSELVRRLLASLIIPDERTKCYNGSEKRSKRLRRSGSAELSSIVSEVDVANLILPWAIKNLLHRSVTSTSTSATRSRQEEEGQQPVNQHLEWKVLFECTRSLLAHDDNKHRNIHNSTHDACRSLDPKNLPLSSKQLSTSILHKLVPFAATIALLNEDAVESSIQNEKGRDDSLTTIHEMAADCYCMFADRLYHPPFETVCKFVLEKFSTCVGQSRTQATKIRYCRMAVATVGLMQKTLKKANPKKAFQTIIRPQTLVVLSNIDWHLSSSQYLSLDTIGSQNTKFDHSTVVSNLINEGLFGIDQHLDGFRSLSLDLPIFESTTKERQGGGTTETNIRPDPMKTSFSCYQEGLFSIVSQQFQRTESEFNSPHHVESMAHIVPLLLKSFILQINALQKQMNEKPTRKKAASNSRKLGQIQFRFFAHMAHPMIQRIRHQNDHGTYHENSSDSCGEQESGFLLHSLQRCLGLLLEHDVYLPVNEDVGDQDFHYLKGISISLVDRAKSTKQDKSDGKGILASLTTILRLNHLVLHEDLSMIVSSCLALIHDEIMEEASSFFTAMISTYKKLRQLDYLCQALLTASTRLVEMHDLSALRAFLLLTKDKRVALSFCEAAQTSPIHQLKEIAQGFGKWVQDAVRAMPTKVQNDSMSASLKSLAIVNEIFSLLLKSARVNATTAQDLLLVCDELIDGPIEALTNNVGCLKSTKFRGALGIHLFGWTVNIQNRCDFWLRNSREDEAIDRNSKFPDQIAKMFHEAIGEVVTETIPLGDEDDTIFRELQFLACHRLQQLHTDTHERQRIAFVCNAEFNCDPLIDETKKVAIFALKALRRTENDVDEYSKSQWDLLAGTLASWAPYAKKDDMRAFLLGFFSRLPSRKWSDTSAGGNIEEDSSLQLLQDASFLETGKLLEHFGPSGVTFIIDCINQGLAGSSRQRKKELASFFSPMVESDRGALGEADMGPILLGEVNVALKKVSFKELKDFDACLRRALTCIVVLNDVQGTVWDSCPGAKAVFESCIRLDSALLEASCHRTSFQFSAIRMIAALRKLVKRILTETESGLFEEFPFTKLFRYLFQSTKTILRSTTGEQVLHELVVDSTKILVQEVVTKAKENESLSDLLDAIDIEYKLNGKYSESDFILLTRFGCSVVLTMSRLDQRESDTEEKVFAAMDKCFWKAVSYALEDSECSDLTRSNSTFFVAILFRQKWLKRNLSFDELSSIEERLVKRAMETMHGDVRKSKLDAMSFLVACYASSKPTIEAGKALVDQLIRPGIKILPIVENAVGDLASRMSSKYFRECLIALTSAHCSEIDAVSRVRMLRSIVLNTNSEELVNELSNFSNKLLSTSLRLMGKTSVAGAITAAVDLIKELASRKAIIAFRERDLCLILSHLISAMRVNSSSPNDFVPANEESFSASFSVASLMLQRFSKQLHFCIPTIISLLRVLLEHSLYGELSDLEAVDRGQKFSRLCELLLPHGEIYKKHILCLLVEFVGALKNNLDPVRKNSIAPAIYCLLDILQQHETLQLNSMLDDMGRALLRTVHENYKKLHVYKGQ